MMLVNNDRNVSKAYIAGKSYEKLRKLLPRNTYVLWGYLKRKFDNC